MTSSVLRCSSGSGDEAGSVGVSSSDQAVVSFPRFGAMQPVQVSLSGVEERGGLRMQSVTPSSGVEKSEINY